MVIVGTLLPFVIYIFWIEEKNTIMHVVDALLQCLLYMQLKLILNVLCTINERF